MRLGVALFVHLSTAAVLDHRGHGSNATSNETPTNALPRGRPNILYFLLDDFGWGDAGWHWESGRNPNGLRTRSMTWYAKKEGLELDRHYVFQFCSPTRSAIQSGRNPLMVNALNLKMNVWNFDDPVSGFAGVPTKMTCLAEKLKEVGYETHIYGKWDIGATSTEQLPKARGYDHSLVYFGHGNDPWKLTGGECSGKVELWDGSQPATLLRDFLGKDPMQCSQEAQVGCTYQERIFYERVKAAIISHTKPFFIFWSTHLVHGPYGVPDRYMEPWKDKGFIKSKPQQLFYGMVDYLDTMFAGVMKLLKERREWNNTLVIVHSDNGAPLSRGHAGNNYPLRGGKVSNWEGGVRVPAFVTGGWLPEERRGQKSDALITAWDWYHTITSLVGSNISDPKAEAAGLPLITDSMNQLPVILGRLEGESPLRRKIYLGRPRKVDDSEIQEAVVSALIRNEYKIIVGTALYNLTTNETGAAQEFRESSNFSEYRGYCGETPETGCLYNIFEDETESNNLAASMPRLFNDMLTAFYQFNNTQGPPFNPNRGTAHEHFCTMTEELHGKFIGPVLGVQHVGMHA